MVKIIDKAKAAFSKTLVRTSSFASSTTARYRGKRKSIIKDQQQSSTSTSSNLTKASGDQPKVERPRENSPTNLANSSKSPNSSSSTSINSSHSSACSSSCGNMMDGGGYSGGDGDLGGQQSGNSNGPPMSNRKLQQTQAKVNEVVGIMKVNVDKVLERDQKLSELDNRADALQIGAAQFEQQAGKLKRKYWWKNIKLMIILGIIGTLILILIIYAFIGDENKQ